MTSSSSPNNPKKRFVKPHMSEPAPLHDILGCDADIDNLTSEQIQALKRHTLSNMPSPNFWGLEGFVLDVLANQELLVAYFRPRPVASGKSPRIEWNFVLPFDCAVRAAERAMSMQVLTQRKDQIVAGYAAFLAPCGIFHAADPRFGRHHGNTGRQPHTEIQFIREELLSDAVRKLRRSYRELGDTIAAVFDLTHGDDFDPSQVAALKVAVSLSQTEVMRLWGGPRPVSN